MRSTLHLGEGGCSLGWRWDVARPIVSTSDPTLLEIQPPIRAFQSLKMLSEWGTP